MPEAEADGVAGSGLVVVTAMPLSAGVRAELSEMLGADYLVLDIKQAPSTANIVLTPVVSGQLLGILRASFPSARILFTELHDDGRGISFSGPVSRIVAQGPDGYFVAHELDAIAPIVQSEARLQLEGNTRRTPPTFALPGATKEVADPPVPPPGEPPGVVSVVWVDRARTASSPPGRWVDLAAVDELVVRVTRAAEPRADPLWPALVAECAVRLATGPGLVASEVPSDVLVDVGGLTATISAEVKIRVSSEGVPHVDWDPAAGTAR